MLNSVVLQGVMQSAFDEDGMFYIETYRNREGGGIVKTIVRCTIGREGTVPEELKNWRGCVVTVVGYICRVGLDIGIFVEQISLVKRVREIGKYKYTIEKRV